MQLDRTPPGPSTYTSAHNYIDEKLKRQLWWKYEAAQEKSQKYKERKFILERIHILGLDGSNYSITLEAQIGGSDAVDA
ncbi:hypothetical protein GBA52_007893 [Prunus armeniaca]|nr:hypothetical protein GBA52_007893 [Prunus armeniaca]